MPSLYNYRLFISHAWRYGKDYDRLISFLDSAPYFSYYNYSAPKERPLFPEGTPLNNKMIASKITDKISPAQIVLVISGMYGAYSDWMGYEINEAVRLGKPILGIYPWGQLSDILSTTNRKTAKTSDFQKLPSVRLLLWNPLLMLKRENCRKWADNICTVCREF